MLCVVNFKPQEVGLNTNMNLIVIVSLLSSDFTVVVANGNKLNNRLLGMLSNPSIPSMNCDALFLEHSMAITKVVDWVHRLIAAMFTKIH